MSCIWKLAIAASVGLSSLTLAGCLSNTADSALSPLKQRELENALYFLEGNLHNLGDVGYTQWTPTTAAAELVTLMNAANALTPAEAADFQSAGIQPETAIGYALNQPTATWQIVLIPDEAQQAILVEAYGTDLTTPVMQKTLPCCEF